MDLWLTATERTRTMETEVMKQIDSLRDASIAELRTKYHEVFQEQTSCKHREHLFRRIAWRLQELTEGGLSDRARARAEEIAKDLDVRIHAPRSFFAAGGKGHPQSSAERNRRQRDRRLPPTGTVLTRKWRDRTVVVEVLAEGFRHDDQIYSSLSALAMAITGTRWNGLAFFGLTRRIRASRKERRHARK
jgi:hypothetical protein